MERINGVSFSNLYLDHELSESIFIQLLKTINQLHIYNIQNEININPYANYKQKLEERFKNFDYSVYPNYQSTYNTILSKLEEYQNLNCVKGTIIHGDPVFTNILLDKTGKVKLIDMRGKLGDTNTIYGDPLYDYAKILQSLVGYDEILLGINVKNNYKSNLINILFKFINSNYDNGEIMLKYIKIVTQSLLFSLIPLHKNNKCLEYYNLINNSYLQ